MLRKIKSAFTKENIKRYFKERMGTLIIFAIAIIFVIWGVISIQIAKRNAAGTAVNYKDYVAREATHNPAEVFAQEYNYQLIASDDKLELYFDYDHLTVQVVDKASNHTWKGAVDGDVYADFRRSNELWKYKMSSSILITFNDMKQRDGMSTELNHAGDCDYRIVTNIENGVSVEYGFTVKGIYVTVEYVLEDGQFVVRVPADKIVEETRYIINTISVLPFFGAANVEKEGYMFYPDGCGAVTLFNNAENRVQSVKKGTWKAYTTNKISLDYWLATDEYERYTAAMPVFGVKHADNAFLAVVTACDEISGITCEPSGCNNVNLNRIYFDLHIRNLFDVSQFNVTTEVGVTSGGRDITRIDKQILAGEREVRYFFLNDDEASYSGMANAYREYLIENGELVDSIEDGEKYPLALSFMMGVTERQLVFDKYVPMTTFENIEQMLNELQAEGIEAGKVVLQHWIKNDEDAPTYWPVANQIGGKKGLANLNDYLADKQNFSVFLANNFIFADEEEGGFSAVSDVVYTGVSKPLSSEYTDSYYALSPSVVEKKAMDFLDKIKSYSNIGVGYTWFGEVVYDDYNEETVTFTKDADGKEIENIVTRMDTINTWKRILAETQVAGKETAATGANRYLYGNADFLYDVPITTYGLTITDYAVPFVQMVISGMIPYASGVYETGNLTYDLDVQKLEWIEFGALPYFYLTYENALKLKDTGYNFLFTSTYSYWKDRVVATYKEFNENFGDTYGEQMVSHEVLGEDIRRVEYSNGKIIYLNYSTEEVIIDGVTIPAIGYTIIGKEAK
ncbi:MAG: hypothetical protein E7261_10445 [Lachnospiraceae bacterium]|nr:hypothetical protein [Lachnospiraceae bacterium]